MTSVGRQWTSNQIRYGYPPVARYPDVACKPHDTPTFFPDGKNAAAVKKAKSICARCPYRDECAAWALRVREPDGVWGGLTAEERQAEIKKLTTRKRPRKVKG
jgi:WhiB family redox-sensing transcriptional regulator